MPPSQKTSLLDGAHDAVAIEAGRKLFAQTCDFVTGAVSLDGLPPAGLPEVAFAGRSNVGKSSLINALTGRRTLARISNTPGRTQQINFFDLGGRLMLVDLPGYGYARAPRAEIDAWTDLVNAYLAGRPTLRQGAPVRESVVEGKGGDGRGRAGHRLVHERDQRVGSGWHTVVVFGHDGFSL